VTAVSIAPPRGQQPRQAGRPARASLTLTEEHVLVLRQVTTGAEKLLTTAEHGRWPTAELAALAGYARAEVLRQASDEEALLFPAVPAQTASVLARDHVRLRAAAELLTRAASGEQPMSTAQLATIVRDFVTQLGRHLHHEETLLASGRRAQGVPATEALGAHPHEWYLLTEGSVASLDELPPEEAVDAAVDRLLRMRRGEQVELRSAVRLDHVWREISKICPGDYQFTVLQDGPARWRIQVSRRQAAI
jgi:uncharacterized protein (DUF2249 family)